MRAMTASPSLAALHARLDRLENANRRYRLGAVAAVLLAFAWVACGVARPKSELSAERFVLLGPDGSQRGVIELDSKGNPTLLFENGASKALLTTNGPSLLLRGPDGKTGAYMGIDPKGDSKLELSSPRVVDGVRLVTHPDGSAGVYVLDTTGRERAGLESFAAGGSAINLRDERGMVRSQYGLDANAIPNLLLLDSAGVRRLGLVVQSNGQGIVELADERGRPRAQLATNFDGSPRFELKREDGGTSFNAP
jgi:hypothetical protein